MGLDRAPIEFQTFYFFHVWLDPPSITVCTIHRMFLRDRPLCHCVTLSTAQLHLSLEMVDCLLTIVKRSRVHALRYIRWQCSIIVSVRLVHYITLDCIIV